MKSVSQIRELKDIQTWWRQTLYWRTHLDVYLRDVYGVNLKDTQQVCARAIGNKANVKIVKSRGYGKSYLVAWCMIGLATLYPNTDIAVVSATAQQATIIMRKIRAIASAYPNVLREIQIVGRDPVVISNEKGKVVWKNGSKIESFSMTAVVGERAKVVVVDEAPRASEQDVKKSATPVANTTRDVCIRYGYEDFESKIISITSACLKSNYFYRDFVDTYKKMRTGDRNCFACALDYKSAIRIGITKEKYFEDRKQELPESVFMTEYGSMFLGEEANSIFPYDLTEQVRTLKQVEYAMPKGGKCWYVISFDIATSQAKGADNAVITVLKCIDMDDGNIMKQVVYIRTYHGKNLEDLSDELRKTYVRFPNTRMIMFDNRGLGDSLPQFMAIPWTDPETGKEYPAWTLANGEKNSGHGIPMLYSFKANVQLNQELVTALRVAIEQKRISIPIPSRSVTSDDEEIADRAYTMEEKAIYIEADALQVELGNIVMKVSGAGSYLYDTAKSNQHKDRFSSLAMGVWYVSKIEDENKRRLRSRDEERAVCMVARLK